MKTLQGVLSVVAAVLAAVLIPTFIFLFRGIDGSKATGIGVVAGSLVESFFSPLFWILAISLFALFFAASRMGSKPLRILLFWTPVTAILALSASIASLYAYLLIHFRQG